MKIEIEKIIKELNAALPVPKKNKNFTNTQAGLHLGLQYSIEKLTKLINKP